MDQLVYEHRVFKGQSSGLREGLTTDRERVVHLVLGLGRHILGFFRFASKVRWPAALKRAIREFPKRPTCYSPRNSPQNSSGSSMLFTGMDQ